MCAEPSFKPTGATAVEVRESFRKQYEVLVLEGRIRFVTFHQSFSYEDFIEGIKPVTEEENDGALRYEVRLGLFRKIALDAAFSFTQHQTNVAYYNHFLAFNERYNNFLSQVRTVLETGASFSLETKTGQKLNIKDISDKDNLTITHGESTKTYIVSKSRLALLAEAYPDVRRMKSIDREVRAVIGGANGSAFWSVLLFIQRNTKGVETREILVAEPKRQFSEEDKRAAVNNIKWQVLEATTPQKSFVLIIDEINRGNVSQIFGELITLLEEDKRAAVNNINWQVLEATTPQKSFVLIIDEINRGNVSQIFGELITLLEEDKRAGGKEALTVRLPYSGESFSVPPNLYIIGTMNTADRSVEALDTALRRRFSFIEMAPREDLLQGKTIEVAGKPYDLGQLLHTINERMELLAGRDHRIGHSYFMNMGNEDWKCLKTVFERNIIPLLQEYFWNDYPRLELVLGAGFVRLDPAQKVRFARTISARAGDIKAALEEKETGHLYDWKEATEQQFGAALDMLLFSAVANDSDG
jgi:5-methylcytosine-specific restriction protein B